MKEQILKLRKEGKTYNQIKSILGCSKGTISYHCGEGQKKKSYERQRNSRKSLKNLLRKKFDAFLRCKVRNFKKGTRLSITNSRFDYFSAYKKITENPVCYLTGRNINLEDTSSYHLDHITPYSKGGENTLVNLGLTCKEANMAKNDLLLDDFLGLCKEILENHNYMVFDSDIG